MPFRTVQQINTNVMGAKCCCIRKMYIDGVQTANGAHGLQKGMQHGRSYESTFVICGHGQKCFTWGSQNTLTYGEDL
jgi:hypothetical protein